jgi:hypothetical protein
MFSWQDSSWLRECNAVCLGKNVHYKLHYTFVRKPTDDEDNDPVGKDHDYHECLFLVGKVCFHWISDG